MQGNVWFVNPLLSVNKLINTYSVYDVWVAYVTGQVRIWPNAVFDFYNLYPHNYRHIIEHHVHV